VASGFEAPPESRTPLKVLVFSTLFPNAAMPNHGIFVETRLRHLTRTGQVAARVVAPVPWVPQMLAKHLRQYAAFARAPHQECREGIEVLHPRYPLIPKVSMTAAPFSMALSAYHVLQRVRAQGFEFDLIDAHYFYPDGVAAALMGWRLAKPLVITARGSDVNLLTRYAAPRRMVSWAIRRAAAIITVSSALREALVDLGVEESKITVVRNGVDLQMFHPSEEASTRQIASDAPALLSVGNLLENKGHHIVIETLQHLSSARLCIVGAGPEEGALRDLTRKLGVGARVTFAGSVPQAELKRYYTAADVLVLASAREGWPNVLLEAMACGTPVVATRAGGVPEIVTVPESGLLAPARTPAAIAVTIKKLLSNYPDRAATHRYAARFGWQQVSELQLTLFNAVLNR
jgi:teichuronic acid biosynthesis glycosyltransferase TuaC